MEIHPKFSIGNKVVSKFKDDWNEFNGEGVIEEVIVLVKYKVKFKGDRSGKFLEDDLKFIN